MEHWRSILAEPKYDEDLEISYNNFKKCIVDATEKVFIKSNEKISQKYSCPWWSKEIEELINKKKKARNKFRKHPTNQNLTIMRVCEN